MRKSIFVCICLLELTATSLAGPWLVSSYEPSLSTSLAIGRGWEMLGSAVWALLLPVLVFVLAAGLFLLKALCKWALSRIVANETGYWVLGLVTSLGISVWQGWDYLLDGWYWLFGPEEASP